VALAESWTTHAPDLSGTAIGVALLSCANAVASERGEEVIEVVWTGPRTNEVPVRLTSAALIDVIEAAKKSLIIVSFAAYKVESILAALKAAASRGVRVRIILETDQAAGGTLTFAARPAFESLKDSVEFYIWPAGKRPELDHGKASLHAKAAIADDHTALVTSANLTGHAMMENMELGLLVRGGPVPRRLSRHFIQLIDEGDLEQQL
jgi:phosphatidylserine/phosphatidylglycerophosphate/cardiolipin synthase-like enzyme